MPSYEANSCSASQGIILWNPKIHNCVHKSLALVTIQRQVNPFFTHMSNLRLILILSSHLCVGQQCGLFLPFKLHYILKALIRFCVLTLFWKNRSKYMRSPVYHCLSISVSTKTAITVLEYPCQLS
jgi:hypothetical protein